MLNRYSLLLPLVLSVLIHGVVIAGGEMISRRSGTADEKKAIAVAYEPEKSQEGSSPAQAAGAVKEKEPSTPFEEGTLSLETPDPLYRPYFKKLRQKIGKHWQDPRREADAGKGGKVLVEFIVSSSGRLRSVEVAESSGVKGYDFSAVKAVKKAGPFNAFPSDISLKELKIRALFVYD